MLGTRTPRRFVLSRALIRAYAANDEINRYLVENLSEETWRARPPESAGRTIAGIVAHMHNWRRTWLKRAGKGTGIKIPPQLNRHSVSRAEAIEALTRSHDAIVSLVGPSLTGDGRVTRFRGDAATFVAYLIAHDAHHRGQICMLSRQLGCSLPDRVTLGMWDWHKRMPES